MSAMREATPAAAFLSITFLMQAAAPLLVLLILQARFLAYQGEGITLYHQSLITLDLFILFMFTRTYIKLWGRGDKLLRTSRYLIASALFAIPTLFVWTVALVPDGLNERIVKFTIVKFNLQQSIAECFFPDWRRKYKVALLFQCNFLEFERFINIQNETISLRDPSPEIVGAIIHTRGELNPKIPCEHVGELDLSDRRLNYANFSGSAFICVKMKKTQLNGSTLFRANLSTANLVGANLSDVNLEGANLREAKLSWAILRKAGLNQADLSGADLSGADLSGVSLSEADLSGARLSRADLSGANLSRANLRKANLSGYNLFGQDLGFIESLAHTISVIKDHYRVANLSGAILDGADLRDADLSGVRMYGAKLYKAQLDGTKLEDAKLFGANFSGSTPRVTSFGKADGEKQKDGSKSWIR